MDHNERFIRIEGLTKEFDVGRSFLEKGQKLRAVDNVSLDIKRGETLGLVGESGCGKSTFGRCVLRLIEPTEGKVLYENKDLLQFSKDEMRKMRRKLQMVFQDPYASLNPRMTVMEIIKAPLDGMCVGRILMESYGDDLKHKVIAYAAAGADARMSGCSMPVVINSGSGNQGMAVSIPVIEYAKEIHASEQTLYRALVLANLVSIYQKVFIGKLSAYCGAVSAAAGAVSGIAWLDGESEEIIKKTIINTICTVGGMVCDGAKPSCASKVAAALGTAILSLEMAKRGSAFSVGEGLVMDTAENTIKSIGRMASQGMENTDNIILQIMLGN